jgi:Rrf2 family protein
MADALRERKGRTADPSARHDGRVQISARADYALRALLVLASHGEDTVKSDVLAESQHLPKKFLEAILGECRRAGLLVSQRGADGGYRLARPAAEIVLGEIIRAVDGPLAGVRGVRPESTAYAGEAEHLQTVWVAVRASLRAVLDEVTLADVLAGDLPPHVRTLAGSPGAWAPR